MQATTRGGSPVSGVGLGYRSEIDGLRAIAVMSVLLFHLDVAWISAGFIGVDVFFVISGYLITAILMQDLAAGRFSLLRFYRRRALRILPPLILVLLVVVALAPVLLLPGEVRETGRAAIAAFLFVSNIFFWRSFDYFTPDAKENPLLHTWSLGIEEQFYLIVPLILWGLWRWFRPGLKAGFAVTVLISFGLSVWMVGSRPQASFYLLPTRYWELGAGALLAMVLPQAFALPRALAEALGLVGIGFILGGLVLLSPDSVFPGINALWPVLGAVALIAAGGGTSVGRCLSLSPMVFLGRISYSLYLWHWPLIVLWKIRMGPDLSHMAQIGLGLMAIVLATLSMKLVEAPFRHLPSSYSDRRVLTAGMVAIALAVVVAFAVQQNPERLRNYPPEVQALARYDGFHASPGFIAWNRRHVCFLASDTPGGFSAYDKETCLGHPPGKPVLLMFGDSLSAHLWHAFGDTYPEYSVVQADASGCRPFSEGPNYNGCRNLMQFIYEGWVPRVKPDVVVLSARWQSSDISKLLEAVAVLRKAGVARVVVLGPTVEYKKALPKLLARDLMTGQQTAASLVDPNRRLVSDEMKAALVQTEAEYIDMLAVLCPEERCQTWVPVAADAPSDAPAVPMSFDYGHYTPEGAEYVAGLLRHVLDLPASRPTESFTPVSAP